MLRSGAGGIGVPASCDIREAGPGSLEAGIGAIKHVLDPRVPQVGRVGGDHRHRGVRTVGGRRVPQAVVQEVLSEGVSTAESGGQ